LVNVIFLHLPSSSPFFHLLPLHPSTIAAMHNNHNPQSSEMIRKDSGNPVEDRKILQSAAASAQFTPSSKVCLLSFVHHLRATFQTSPSLSTPFLCLECAHSRTPFPPAHLARITSLSSAARL
jgi:hypothetical protein